MQNIEESIKQLKNVGPSEEYKAESLRLILTYPQNIKKPFSVGMLFDMLKLGAALGLTGMLIMISVTDIFPNLNARLLSPVLLSSLDKQKIENEADQVDIKITVSEAKYYSDSLTKVAVALDETAKNGPAHLDPTLLNNEMDQVDSIDQQNSGHINDILNKLTL